MSRKQLRRLAALAFVASIIASATMAWTAKLEAPTERAGTVVLVIPRQPTSPELGTGGRQSPGQDTVAPRDPASQGGATVASGSGLAGNHITAPSGVAANTAR